MRLYWRRLPHIYTTEQPVFLTWRLHASLPPHRPFTTGTLSSGRAFAALDRLLDEARTGPLYLREPSVADLVVEAIQYNDCTLAHYELHAFVVMPNHVHLLVTPAVALPKLAKSLKGITAKRANKMLGMTGHPFWQEESYDHTVRHEREFERIRRYIEENPVRAGLARQPSEYRWSSARWATGGSPADLGSAPHSSETALVVIPRPPYTGSFMAYRFRHSICNEVYEGWNFAESCKSIRKAGYDGIEIAPFTLSEFPASITAAQRKEHRAAIEGEGLEFVGLHWLMVAPKGLHVTTPDKELRARSWQHIRDLIDLSADLAGDRPHNGVMVFGSPKQRATTGGLSREEATKNYSDGLASVAGHAAERRVTILVEHLPSRDCDIVNTLAEAAAIVRQINSPAVQTMFDTHNATDETDPHQDVVDRFFDMIRHIHVNEMDGRHPGTGDYDFKPILQTLGRRGYKGYISLEVFDFKPGAEKIATDSLRFLEREIQKLYL